ncbi:MAG: hypothetical protein IJV41_05000, partial [Oscillospiraceae bacterium]|nr:hypothetical protein [Oscillospiraceae bacterium]
ERTKDPAAALLIQIFAGFCLCLVIAVNANRMNFLLLPLVLCAALGADALCSLAGRHAAKLAAGLAAVYLIFFGFFAKSYFTDYADALRGQFTWGVQDALETALAHEGTVYFTDAVSYSKLLLIAEIDPYTFHETVEYERYPAAYLSARRIGRWRFCPDKRMPFDPAGIYILWGSTDPAPYVGAGFTAERHGCFIVLWRE